MDIDRLFKDFNIQVASPSEKHYRDGWRNLPCPYCYGHVGNHLGFCLDKESKYFNRFICYRCGGHKTTETIALLLKVSESEAKSIIHQYGGYNTFVKRKRDTLNIITPIREIELPPESKELHEVAGAVRYLKARNFDIDYLESVYDVKATGPLAYLNYNDKMIDLSYRIIIPITFNGKTVSWQCRDWTNKSKLKYITCPPELESKFHKHILYGWDQAQDLSKVVLVEGVTDVWAWGAGALASFGIKFLIEQIRLLKRFDLIGTFYDEETQAQMQARKVIAELRQYGLRVVRLRNSKGSDPGSTSKDKITEIKEKFYNMY
jgi:hypothetical protein